jgi:hypothetical protein
MSHWHAANVLGMDVDQSPVSSTRRHSLIIAIGAIGRHPVLRPMPIIENILWGWYFPRAEHGVPSRVLGRV